MSPRTKPTEPRQLAHAEIVEDFKRAIIAALLGQRTWSSEDLNRTLTVAQVAERLTFGEQSLPQ